MTEIQNSKQIK